MGSFEKKWGVLSWNGSGSGSGSFELEW
jgi:hypothetical protein